MNGVKNNLNKLLVKELAMDERVVKRHNVFVLTVERLYHKKKGDSFIKIKDYDFRTLFLGIRGDGWMENLKEIEGKKIFVELKTGRRYTGIVQIVENGFIKLLDKFNSLVYINEEEIIFLEEQRL